MTSPSRAGHLPLPAEAGLHPSPLWPLGEDSRSPHRRAGTHFPRHTAHESLRERAPLGFPQLALRGASGAVHLLLPGTPQPSPGWPLTTVSSGGPRPLSPLDAALSDPRSQPLLLRAFCTWGEESYPTLLLLGAPQHMWMPCGSLSALSDATALAADASSAPVPPAAPDLSGQATGVTGRPPHPNRAGCGLRCGRPGKDTHPTLQVTQANGVGRLSFLGPNAKGLAFLAASLFICPRLALLSLLTLSG